MISRTFAAAFEQLRRGRLLFIFILCVLLPTIPIAYLAMQSLAVGPEALADNVNAHIQRVGLSLVRMVTRAVLDCEDGLAQLVRPGLTLGRLVEGIGETERACPLALSVFLLDSRLRPLFPFRYTGERSIELLAGTRPDARSSEYFRAMREGSRREFGEANPGAALGQYAAAARSAKDAQGAAVALNAAARCCVKTGRFADAAGYYKEIAGKVDGNSVYNGLSLRLLALYGNAMAEAKQNHGARAIELFVEILRGLAAGELASSVAEASFYASMIQGQMDAAPPGASAEFPRAFLQWEQRKQAADAMETLREAFRTDFQKAFEEPGPAEGRFMILSRTVEGEEVMLLYRLIAVQGAASPVLMAVVLDAEEVREGAHDLLTDALETEADVNVLLTDAQGAPVIAKGLPADSSRYVVRRSLAPLLPLWQITLAYRNDGTLFKAAMRERRTRLGYISFLLLIIILGLYITYRSIRKDSELMRLKSDFVSRVSHELRTPLSTIRALGEMLEIGAVSSREKEKEYFAFITTESERLTRLVNNVLDFSQIGAGKRIYTLKPADVAKTVSATVTAFREYVKPDGFDIVYERDERIPGISADEDALSQALINLMDNAVKFSRDEKIVRVELRRRDGDVLIRVSDRGIGIAPADLPKIFAQFHRLDDARKVAKKGAGIGLSIVKHIAEAHGGRVEVKSVLGEGSEFTIVLPSAPGRTQTTG